MESKQLKAAILGLLGTVLGPQPLADQKRVLVAVPDGYRIDDLEKHQPAPYRTRGNSNLYSYASFIDYVKVFKEAGSRIFVVPDLVFTEGGQMATAYLDFPVPGTPSWTTHTAVLNVSPSLEYQLLCSLDGGLHSQDDFYSKLKLLQQFCTSMQAADLLEMARTLQLASKGKYANIRDDFSGSINFIYDVQVAASAGTEAKRLEVPRFFQFKMALLNDGPERDITTEFCYRLPKEGGDGKVQMGIRIVDRVYIERDELRATAATLGKDTGVPVYIGNTIVPEHDNAGD